MLSIFISRCSFGQKEFATTHVQETIVDSVSYNYDKGKVLERFCVVLYDLKKHFHYHEILLKFLVNGNEPAGFFVYDLVDTLNNSVTGSIKFKEGHVYHFAPRDLYFSYSNICVLIKGRLIFFKALNCKKNINSINEVGGFLRSHLSNSIDLDKIIARTMNYRHYGKYHKVDYAICACEW